VPVRHPVLVAAGRHYGLEVATSVMADPESKGGSEATVRVAKADLVPTDANLLDEYERFGELVSACERLCAEVNGWPHSETGRAPADALAEERGHLHLLPREPYTAALGETRTVEDDQTVRYGSVWPLEPADVPQRVRRRFRLCWPRRRAPRAAAAGRGGWASTHSKKP
jgi:hypothetical protein